MYIHICIYIYIHIYTHTYVYIYIYTYICVCIYIYMWVIMWFLSTDCDSFAQPTSREVLEVPHLSGNGWSAGCRSVRGYSITGLWFISLYLMLFTCKDEEHPYYPVVRELLGATLSSFSARWQHKNRKKHGKCLPHHGFLHLKKALNLRVPPFWYQSGVF